MDVNLINFVAGAVVGFTVAAIIGRGKFLAVQKQARSTRDYFERQLNQVVEQSRDIYKKYIAERSLNDGLTQELHAVSTKTRFNTTV